MADNKIIIGRNSNTQKTEPVIDMAKSQNQDMETELVISKTAEQDRDLQDVHKAKRKAVQGPERKADVGIGQEPVQEADGEAEDEPLDEEVWGNDLSILDMIDESTLADRRLFTRVIYMQRTLCSAIIQNIDDQEMPVILNSPIEFTIIDISMGGIGIICEQEIEIGTILVFKIILDNIAYEVKYSVIYCFKNDGKFRAGLKIAKKDMLFIRHLKIVIARISLNSKYGNQVDL